MRFALLCCLVAVGLAAASNRRQLWQSEESLRNAEPFRSGKEYRFQYNTQVSSGLGSVEYVDQKSTHRLSASIRVHFETERSATLRMESVRVGVLNGPIADPRRVQPMQLFESSTIDSELLEQLNTPLKFDHVDGLVERIFFHSKDSAWSKNIKRAVLNMLQLNMKRRDTNIQGFEMESRNDEDKNVPSRMFTLPETSLEGECMTVYTINKVDNVERSEEAEYFNVTKTVDFKQCKKVASIRYGPRSEKPHFQTTQQEIEQQQLERSTVLRYQLSGTPEKYAIARVELLSQYVYKSLNAETEQPMQTIVAAELEIQAIEAKTTKISSSQLQTKEETLLYSAEWDTQEKRFYQYGDDEFSRESSPFAKVATKTKQILQIIKKIAHSATDKVNGIETETTLKLQQLVELVRMCSVSDLEKIRESILDAGADKHAQEEMFYDVLAIAGTRNSIHYLVREIISKKISTGKAVQALQQLSGLPAPSDKQIDEVIRLCKADVAKESEPLRQSCWLTAGSMIGELCKESIYENAQESEQQCPRHKKEKYQKALYNLYETSETEYEKILALKAVGNAAIDLAVFDLEKIISDRTQSPVVRQQAIDSLRRLRNQMPKKIQRVLMPVFKNTQEQPEVRMSAFSMIMHTLPEKAVLDQITFVLFNERNQHVKSFVYSTMKALSTSPVEIEQTMAKHLQTALKMAKIDEDELRTSRFYRVPIYSHEQREGVFFNWESIFSTNNMLPKQVALKLDSVLNGLFEKNNFELSLTQNDLERYYEQFVESFYASGASRGSLRANRREQNGQEQLDSIFDDLKITNRRESSDNQPFGMLCLRIRDVDQIVVPLSEDTIPESVKPLFRGESPSLMQMWDLLDGKHFRVASVASFHERSLKIATSCGMPLRMLHTIPVIAAIQGELKIQLGEQTKVHIKIQPVISGVHSQKMELWCPIVNTGVESLRSIELNLPIEADVSMSGSVENELNEKIKMVVRLPEHKTRVFGFHSLPLTFIREYDSKLRLHREPKVMTIRNIQMEPRLVELSNQDDESTSRRSAWSVSGHVHKPSTLSYSALVAIAKVTENHVHIEFEPIEGAPKSIEMSLFSKLFKQVKKESASPRFESFYESKNFETVYSDDFEAEGELESNAERRQKLDRYVSSEYSPRQVYKHSIRAQYKTLGGRKEHQGQFQLDATCDSQIKYCKINTEITRSPIASETQDWKLSAKAQIMTPEYVREVEELNEASNKHNKFVASFEAQWGSGKRQNVELKVQGERAVPQKWIQRSGSEWRRQFATAFINKYDMVCSYSLNEQSESYMSRVYEMLKVWNMWNSDDVETITSRDNHVYATLIIDPRTRQHLNVSVKTPTERVRYTNIQLPMTFKPLALIRPQEQPREIDSVSELFEDMADSRRAECKVNGRTIKTFDQVIYKTPIGPCYSVIAKDCARKSFVVMMKTLNDQTSDKKIKIITKDNTIEVEARNDKLHVTVNGDRINDIEQLQEYNIDYSDDFVMINLPQGVSIRFDGQQATVKMSTMYKKSQCGLCGNFDEQDDDEFRMNDNRLTEDLKEFHKSYTLMTDDEECKQNQHNKIYEQDRLFGKKSSRKEFYGEQDQDDEESGFESDEQADEYELFSNKKNQRKQAKQSDETRREESDESEQPRREQEEESDSSEEQERQQELIKKTKVMEYNHKICFSMKPVKHCPRQQYAETSEDSKVQFTCFNRSSTEGRRLLREARTKDITEKLSEKKTSFVETVSVPTKCSQY